MELGQILEKAMDENEQQGILIVEGDGKICRYNQRFLQIWGLESAIDQALNDAELIAFAKKQLLDPDSFTNNVQSLYEHRDQKSSDILLLKGDRYIERYSTPLQDEAGNYLARIWYFHDVSERERMRRQLQDGNARYQDLFENMNDAFALHQMILDESGKAVDYVFLECNPYFLARIGLTREQVINHRAKELFPQTEQAWIDAFAKVALTGERSQFTSYSVELDRYYQTSLYCPRHGYFAGIFADVTDLKKAEKEREQLIKNLEAKNAELERFAYSVSHDLRSPLVSIQGFSSEAIESLNEGSYQDAKEYLQRVVSASSKMGNLLADLLTYARVARADESSHRVQMNHILQEALQNLQGTPNFDKAQIQYDQDLGSIVGSESRLISLWQNLLENSIKYCKPGQAPVIHISHIESNADITYTIADQGIGIDPKFHINVFTLFNKLDPTTPGTGAGLTIVQRIIEMAGGKIWIESELGKGCRVIFKLPKGP